MSFCYNESVIRLSWFGAVLVVGTLACFAQAPVTHAQEEIEVITEPPPQVEPPPGEPAPEPTPPPDTPPKVEPPKPKLGQLRVAAGIGIGFGSDIITFGISPQVSYVFKKIVEPGIAVKFGASDKARLILADAEE